MNLKLKIRVMLLWACCWQAGLATADDNPWAEPIWKSPPIPENPDAEFDSHDPYALSVGAYIKTDCSIRYVWHVDGKLYCFNSLTSKAFFMDAPARYIREAEAFLGRGE